MSTMPAPPIEAAGDPGYLMLLRGQPFNGYSPAKHGPLWNYRLLPSRAGDAGTLLFQYTYDRTWSAWGCPEWAKIPFQEFCEYMPHKSPRAIRWELKGLEQRRLIERHPNDPWSFKTHPENVATAPALEPVRHPNAAAKKQRTRAARVSTSSCSALRNEAASGEPVPSPHMENQFPQAEGEQPVETGFNADIVAAASNGGSFARQPDPGSSDQLKPVSNEGEDELIGKPVSSQLKPVSEIAQPVASQGAASFRPDESHCPLNYACPYFDSDLAGRKPLTQINPTMQAGRSAPFPEGESDRPATECEIQAIRKLLREELSDKIPGDEPADGLCQRIHGALQGTPLEWTPGRSDGLGLLRYRIRRRWKDIEGYGLVELLAQDIGKHWRESQVKARQLEQEESVRNLKRLTEHLLDSFRQTSEDWQALSQFAQPRRLNASVAAV